MTFPRRERDVRFALTFPSLQCALVRSFFACLSVWCLSFGTTHCARGEEPLDPPELGM